MRGKGWSNWTRYEVDDRGCWLWTGPVNPKGYGKISAVHYGTTLAHRAFFLRSGRSIPAGQCLDHLCKVPSCVNPDHLEPVSPYVNLIRGKVLYANRTTCKSGLHDITDPKNVKTDNRGQRECLLCSRESKRKSGAAYRARNLEKERARYRDYYQRKKRKVSHPIPSTMTRSQRQPATSSTDARGSQG